MAARQSKHKNRFRTTRDVCIRATLRNHNPSFLPVLARSCTCSPGLSPVAAGAAKSGILAAFSACSLCQQALGLRRPKPEARAAMAAAAEASLAPLQRGQEAQHHAASFGRSEAVQAEVLETSLPRGLWAD